MRRVPKLIGMMLARTIVLLLLVLAGTATLIRCAPGYLSEARELNAQDGEVTREHLRQQRLHEGGSLRVAAYWVASAMHGDLGLSSQYEVPVSVLVRERSAATLRLLVIGLALGWAGAWSISLVSAAWSASRVPPLFLMAAAWMLAIPVGALSTFCFLTDIGGPILVIAVLTGARDLQYCHRMLRDALQAPHFLQLRASGVRTSRIFWAFAAPQLLPQAMALGLMSFVTAFGLIVPVEVVFDVPGLGQMAWSATMNRDLPVLLAISVLIAACLAVAGTLADLGREGIHA